ncbi:hypothetical protein KKC08_04080 [Patescibacteria group bacterium]|nr:hypothetical protein [Patescibacteria group bacterium]MCG2702302.1 hypothetical protein [Candidatus Parcubacteria bacterium]MBU4264581.1 hypothetical protein [Patescibacteria group bacterium]MBU4390249.1 hypothetical protein [Patescibacteria group bacterium]MBU4397319.1 hypothetical protein [Patescibacteria group bacterium]
MIKKDLVDQKEVNRLLEKVKAVQVKNKLDLSSDEDLSIAIMNLISIEEHMFFTAMKTEKIGYLDILNETREMRKKLLKKIVKDYEGEVWCISKHLLAASMRLNEVGTKSLGRGRKKEAFSFFKMAYQLYSTFWGLNLGVIKSKGLKNSMLKLGFKKNEFMDSEKLAKEKKGGLFEKMGELVKKAINCCIE